LNTKTLALINGAIQIKNILLVYTNSMEVFMKIDTTHSTDILDRWARFLGAMLTVALMMPTVSLAINPNPNPEPVVLVTADNFAVLAAAGISNTGSTVLTGDIGSYPTDAITGFGPGTFTGTNYGNTVTTQTAMTDLNTAYGDAATRPGANTIATELGAANLTAGVYTSASGTFGLTGTLTLTGDANSVFIFQMATTLTTASSSQVILDGVEWTNVFWQVGSSATLGESSHLEGTILAQTSITVGNSATVNGRLLAGAGAWSGTAWDGDLTGAVTLENNTVDMPVVTAVENGGIAPQEFSLMQNYPNPFNPSTQIQYTIGKAGLVSLKVYNVLGCEVAALVNGRQEAGSYTVPFGINKGTLGLSSGVYFYRLEAGSFVSTKKLILMK
jgi:hypothetical protein